MNFTDNPFERMMKQVPRQGGGRAKPCRGTVPPPQRKPKERPEAYWDIIITSGQFGPKSK